jgi:hypothetical protein
MNKTAKDKFNRVKAYVDLLNQEMAELEKELKGSGAPKSSARKGQTKSAIDRVLAKRQKQRLKQK